jgi:flagellar protein FliS
VDILRELNGSLDLAAGGQLANTLRDLYAFFERHLIESNLKKSRQGIDEVIPMLKQLRDAWFQMLSGNTSSLPAVPAWPDSRLANV